METYQVSRTGNVPSGQPVNNERKHNNNIYNSFYVTMWPQHEMKSHVANMQHAHAHAHSHNTGLLNVETEGETMNPYHDISRFLSYYSGDIGRDSFNVLLLEGFMQQCYSPCPKSGITPS